MRLKTLEVKGLKSFADQTLVHFNDNITGIVGPNGCGKSNIIDAIRWVLGEQKPSRLRVEKMEDLVFNGTRNRKASGMAEVSLTFENTKNILPTEYQTVTIKRVLYRGGDSEYKINDITCRLKDIQNLFMDTGINSDSYAIIELGMVDDILKDVDNSRRKIFEQAAGISKYKIRKKETLSKLNATDADLNRINDLLFEIDNNIAQLERQAKRTQQYYKLKDAYKELSVQYAVIAIRSFKSSSEDILKKEEQESDKKRQLEAEIHVLESQLEKLKTDTIQYEQELSTSQKALNEFLDQLRNAENNRNILKQRIDFVNERKSTILNQNVKDTEQLQQVESSIQVLEKSKETESRLLADIQVQLTTIAESRKEAEIEMNGKSEILLSIQKTHNENEKKYIDLEKNIAVSQSQKNNIIKNIHLRREEAATKGKEMEDLKVKHNEALENKTKVFNELQAMQQAEEQLQVNITTLSKEIDDERQALNDENRTLTGKQTEYNVLHRMVESLDGYPESIKYLKQNNEKIKKVPMLGDILSVAAPYSQTIETYLEPYLTYFIVADEAEALQAIQQLQSHNKGRANFFILSAFENIARKEYSTTQKRALDVVECESQYNALVNYFFNDVVIADANWDQHIENPDLIYLAQDATYIRRKYSITGGIAGVVKGSKLGKSKELENLQKEIQVTVEKMEQMKAVLFKKQDALNELKKQSQTLSISQMSGQHNIASNQALQLQTRIEQYSNFLNQYDSQFTGWDEEIAKLEESIDLMQKDYYVVQGARKESSEALQNANTDYKIAFDKHDAFREKYNETNIKFHQQENRLQAIINELQFKNQQIQNLQNNLTQNATQIEQLQQEYNEKEYELKAVLETLQKSYMTKEELEKNVHIKEQDYYKIKGDINEAEKNIREQLKQKENTDLLLMNLRDKVNDMKLHLTSVRERLQIEFNLNLNEVIENQTDEQSDEYEKMDEAELKSKVESAKKRLENFGEYNPMAVEAYNEMKIRYDNIVMQKEDLDQAKHSLLQTIREIDTVAKENFMDAFTKIRENFIKVFRSLFTEEDQCDLLLVNPEDPLESPIDIIAKPKGKRPQNISQLSGGEKTLTATALLFSIYLIKPAPFCIFDEVDAPLDDTNIEKFAKIIKEFSKNSQFIVVTHNKQTMASVDVMYGVTMAEQGVSKLVPVDFRHLN